VSLFVQSTRGAKTLARTLTTGQIHSKIPKIQNRNYFSQKRKRDYQNFLEHVIMNKEEISANGS